MKKKLFYGLFPGMFIAGLSASCLSFPVYAAEDAVTDRSENIYDSFVSDDGTDSYENTADEKVSFHHDPEATTDASEDSAPIVDGEKRDTFSGITGTDTITGICNNNDEEAAGFPGNSDPFTYSEQEKNSHGFGNAVIDLNADNITDDSDITAFRDLVSSYNFSYHNGQELPGELNRILYMI